MHDNTPTDRARANTAQRRRRARMVRIDYMPTREAVAIMQALRDRRRPGTPPDTNSAVLDAIVIEWAKLKGLEYVCTPKPMTSGNRPEFLDNNARARITSDGPSLRHTPKERVTCGARRRRDGQPCQAFSLPGKRRCKWHGGASTGPKTEAGKHNSLANLRPLGIQISASMKNMEMT